MEIFFTIDCYKKFKKICKNSSHEHLFSGLYGFFKERESLEKWKTGFRISQGPNGGLFLKDRFEGSGGYRFYFLLTISEEDVTISSFYPKKGKHSKKDLTTSETKESLKSGIQSRIDKNRFKVKFDPADKKISFISELIKPEKIELKKF